MSEHDEERRVSLALEAAPLRELSQQFDSAKGAMREAEAAEDRRHDRALEKLAEKRKALGKLSTRRAIAARADISLKSEFVEPKLIRAVSAAEQTAGQARLAAKAARDDLRSIRRRIEVLREQGKAAGVIELEEKRSVAFEVRAARAVEALTSVEAPIEAAKVALSEAWDVVRHVETA